tara:strand:+ start:407 stop:652 length:246 start_codon:yes stop_codon:yes gene_type:complete
VELLIVYRLALSAVTATFGTAFAKWFFTTKIGVWVQQKFEALMNYLQKKYDIEIAKKEAAWRRDYPLLAKRIDEIERKLDE